MPPNKAKGIASNDDDHDDYDDYDDYDDDN